MKPCSIYPGAYAPESLASLRGFWKRVHELTADEAHKFMGNGIVANGSYLTPYVTPHLESILRQEGSRPSSSTPRSSKSPAAACSA